MIVIKHGHKPEPKRWKFKCRCGCEWIADETEVTRIWTYQEDIRPSYLMTQYHAMCSCPDCEHNVVAERRVDADEFENIWMQTEAPIRYIDQTEEEQK